MPADVSLPPVPGDPAGMRALAAALRSDASLLAVIAAETASTVQNLEFSGPAATRLDGRVAGASRSVGNVAEEPLMGPSSSAGQTSIFSLPFIPTTSSRPALRRGSMSVFWVARRTAPAVFAGTGTAGAVGSHRPIPEGVS